jgi:hypothetical protein
MRTGGGGSAGAFGAGLAVGGGFRASASGLGLGGIRRGLGLVGALGGDLAEVEAALGVEDQAGVEVGQRDVVDAHRQRRQPHIHPAKIKRLPLEEVGGVELVHRREIAQGHVALEAALGAAAPPAARRPACRGT